MAKKKDNKSIVARSRRIYGGLYPGGVSRVRAPSTAPRTSAADMFKYSWQELKRGLGGILKDFISAPKTPVPKTPVRGKTASAIRAGMAPVSVDGQTYYRQRLQPTYGATTSANKFFSRQTTPVGAGRMSSGMTTGGAFGTPLMVGSNLAVPPAKPKQQMLPATERYARAKDWSAREFAGEPAYVKGPDISIVPATSGELVGGVAPQDNRKALIRIDWRGVEPKAGHRAQMEASRRSALQRLRENPKFVEHEARQQEARSAEARAAALTRMREQRAARDAARRAAAQEQWMLGMASRNPSIASLIRQRLQAGGQVAAAQEKAKTLERIEQMRQEGEAARQRDLLDFYREQGTTDPEQKIAMQSAATSIYERAIASGATPYQANMAAREFYPEFVAPASPEELAREEPAPSLLDRIRKPEFWIDASYAPLTPLFSRLERWRSSRTRRREPVTSGAPSTPSTIGR